MRTHLARAWIGVTLIATIAACTKLNLGGGPIPTPSTSPTGPPTPTACGTPNSNANLVVVAMSNSIGPTSVPPYGTINGYAVVENGSVATHAEVINQWLKGGVLQPITSKNVLQFTNIDPGVLHSAVGFMGNGFPSTPYTFPTAAASPTATAVSSTSLWSTGRIAAPTSQQCYSQTFTLTAGTYYFGDLDYYNLSNFRDVLIVASPSPRSMRYNHLLHKVQLIEPERLQGTVSVH